MINRIVVYLALATLVALVAIGTATDQASSMWQVAFFVMLGMSMVFLVADRQKPV